jgi:hypothetical protein
VISGSALLAALLMQSVAVEAKPRGPRLPTRAELKACPKLADLDFKAVYAAESDAGPTSREALDALHERTRGGELPTIPADAEIILRTWAGPAETQETPTETSSIVWKGADGVWRVDRVDYKPTVPVPPPDPPANWDGVSPLPTVTAADEFRARHVSQVGALLPQQAEFIERTLRDPCFALQPDSIPFVPPTKRGKPPIQPCWGISGGMLEIRWRDGRRREVAESCDQFYAIGIIQAVMYAQASDGSPAQGR